MAFVLKTYPEILAALEAAISAQFPGALITERSLLKTLLHAVATQDAEGYAVAGKILDGFSIDTATRDALRRRARDYGPEFETPIQPQASVGQVKFSDGANTFGVVQGTLSASYLAGVTSIVLNAGQGALFTPFLPSFSVVLSRGTVNEEVVAVSGVAGDTLTVSATTLPHTLGDTVYRATAASDRLIALGTQVYARNPSNLADLNAQIVFETLAAVTLLNGDVETSLVDVRALKTGEAGNVLAGKIAFFAQEKPFADCLVTNPAYTSGGTDEETDQELRERIRLYVSSLTVGAVPAALSRQARNVTSGLRTVRRATVQEPVGVGASVVWIDDGTTTLSYDVTSTSALFPSGRLVLVYNATPQTQFAAFPLAPMQSAGVNLYKSGETGDATAIGVLSLTDSTKAWVVNAYTGWTLIDDNGAQYLVASNTATVLTLTQLTGQPTTPSLGPYSLVDTSSGALTFADASLLQTTPWTTQDCLIDYETGELRLNPAIYPTGLASRESLVALDYNYTSGLVREVSRVLNGDKADLATYPGYKAAGTMVQVRIPARVSQSVVVRVVPIRGVLEASIVASVQSEVATYINGLGIGEAFLLSEAIRRVKALTSVYDCAILSPLANVVVSSSTLLRTDSTLINVV